MLNIRMLVDGQTTESIAIDATAAIRYADRLEQHGLPSWSQVRVCFGGTRQFAMPPPPFAPLTPCARAHDATREGEAGFRAIRRLPRLAIS